MGGLIISIYTYGCALADNHLLAVAAILTFAVILVNGWTDAPNAIATCVSTRAMKPHTAVLMAAVFNFLGVLTMTLLNSTVAETIYKMVDFGCSSHTSLIALCAALTAIVVWAACAWYFGIPTSESHALVAGISGAAIAIHGGLEGINGAEWVKVFYGLGLSVVAGIITGFVMVRMIERLCRNWQRRKSFLFFRWAQIVGGAGMAFMHGAQDGQKFMGIFLLGIVLANNETGGQLVIPIWLMVLCSFVMAIGTSMGGYRIIKSVGMDMVKLKKYQGFSADLASALCLLFASLFGWPVSTTHTKSTAILGVGAAKRLSSVNWSVVRNMMAAWLLTFPGCGLMGFLMVKIFMKLWG